MRGDPSGAEKKDDTEEQLRAVAAARCRGDSSEVTYSVA